jgi:hypothetical protein
VPALASHGVTDTVSVKSGGFTVRPIETGSDAGLTVPAAFVAVAVMRCARSWQGQLFIRLSNILIPIVHPPYVPTVTNTTVAMSAIGTIEEAERSSHSRNQRISIRGIPRMKPANKPRKRRVLGRANILRWRGLLYRVRDITAPTAPLTTDTSVNTKTKGRIIDIALASAIFTLCSQYAPA